MNIFIYEVEIVNVYKGNIGQDLVRLVSKQLFRLGTPVDSTAVLIPAPPAPAFWKAQRRKFVKQAWREERGRGGKTP